MPRGISFDRYEIPRGGLGGAPGYKIPAPDDSVAGALASVSRLASNVGDVLLKAAEAKEQAKVGEAYLTAVEEMDRQFLALQHSPDREKAAESWNKYIEQALPKWSKGLSEHGTAALETRLVPKRAEYAHKARMLEIQDLTERSARTRLGFGKAFVDAFARSGPDGPEPTEEWLDLQRAYGAAVAANLIRQDVAEKELRAYRQEAAATKAYGMVESNDSNALRRLKDLFSLEEENPGSTFLKYVDADRRVALKKTLNLENERLRQQRIAAANRAREANERRLRKEQEEWERRSDTMVENGTITEAWIEDGKQLGLASDEKARFYRKAMQDRKTGEAGPNDEATFRRLSMEVYSELSNPASLLRQVKLAYADRRLNYPTMKEWASHLEARIKHAETVRTAEQQRQQQQLDKERPEVEEYIKILTTTRSPFEKFDPVANRLRLNLMTELGKLPREQSAKEWYFKNEARFIGQMRGLAQGYIRTERASMNIRDDGMPPSGQPVAVYLAPKKAEYQRKYGAEWKTKMIEDIDRLERIRDLQAEIDSKKPQGHEPPGPKPATSAPSIPTTPGGPLRPGSRAY